MFLSVITPTKNSEKFISDTVKSVISQNFKEYEHIILDNLSSDNTLQNIKKFRNKKIKIVSEKDNGIYYAMNKGANLSKGNFLTFLNSDDFILDKDFFKNAYSILNKHKYDILYSNITCSILGILLKELYAVLDQIFIGQKNGIFCSNLLMCVLN